MTEDAGLEAIELADSVGLCLDPWQQLFVRVAMAENSLGLWAAPEVGKLVARQNGKGAGLEAVFLHGLFLDERMKLQLWTAHQFKTSTEAFIRIRGWIDGTDDLRRRVKRINAAHGEEGIELLDGSRLRFLARSKSSGRGFSPQRLGLDEAQELSDAAVEAIMPALSAQPAKHILYAGTVPGPDTNHPEVFQRVRDRGRSRKARFLAWMEWTPPGSEDPEVVVDLDDRANWEYSNPGAPYRLSEESITAEREAMSDEGFARERLSIWPTLPVDDGLGLLSLAKWDLRLDTQAQMVDPVVFAVHVARDRSKAAIAVAGRSPEGVPIVEVVEHQSGVAWVADQLPDRIEALAKKWGTSVVVDPLTQANTLIPELTQRGIQLTTVASADVAEACGAFYTAVMETGDLKHRGDPRLRSAVEIGVTRPLQGRWAWDDREGDITTLVAATLARHGLTALVQPFFGSWR